MSRLERITDARVTQPGIPPDFRPSGEVNIGKARLLVEVAVGKEGPRRVLKVIFSEPGRKSLELGNVIGSRRYRIEVVNLETITLDETLREELKDAGVTFNWPRERAVIVGQGKDLYVLETDKVPDLSGRAFSFRNALSPPNQPAYETPAETHMELQKRLASFTTEENLVAGHDDVWRVMVPKSLFTELGLPELEPIVVASSPRPDRIELYLGWVPSDDEDGYEIGVISTRRRKPIRTRLVDKDGIAGESFFADCFQIDPEQWVGPSLLEDQVWETTMPMIMQRVKRGGEGAEVGLDEVAKETVSCNNSQLSEALNTVYGRQVQQLRRLEETDLTEDDARLVKTLKQWFDKSGLKGDPSRIETLISFSALAGTLYYRTELERLGNRVRAAVMPEIKQRAQDIDRGVRPRNLLAEIEQAISSENPQFTAVVGRYYRDQVVELQRLKADPIDPKDQRLRESLQQQYAYSGFTGDPEDVDILINYCALARVKAFRDRFIVEQRAMMIRKVPDRFYAVVEEREERLTRKYGDLTLEQARDRLGKLDWQALNDLDNEGLGEDKPRVVLAELVSRLLAVGTQTSNLVKGGQVGRLIERIYDRQIPSKQLERAIATVTRVIAEMQTVERLYDPVLETRDDPRVLWQTSSTEGIAPAPEVRDSEVLAGQENRRKTASVVLVAEVENQLPQIVAGFKKTFGNMVGLNSLDPDEPSVERVIQMGVPGLIPGNIVMQAIEDARVILARQERLFQEADPEDLYYRMPDYVRHLFSIDQVATWMGELKTGEYPIVLALDALEVVDPRDGLPNVRYVEWQTSPVYPNLMNLAAGVWYQHLPSLKQFGVTPYPDPDADFNAMVKAWYDYALPKEAVDPKQIITADLFPQPHGLKTQTTHPNHLLEQGLLSLFPEVIGLIEAGVPLESVIDDQWLMEARHQVLDPMAIGYRDGEPYYFHPGDNRKYPVAYVNNRVIGAPGDIAYITRRFSASGDRAVADPDGMNQLCIQAFKRLQKIPSQQPTFVYWYGCKADLGPVHDQGLLGERTVPQVFVTEELKQELGQIESLAQQIVSDAVKACAAHRHLDVRDLEALETVRREVPLDEILEFRGVWYAAQQLVKKREGGLSTDDLEVRTAEMVQRESLDELKSRGAKKRYFENPVPESGESVSDAFGRFLDQVTEAHHHTLPAALKKLRPAWSDGGKSCLGVRLYRVSESGGTKHECHVFIRNVRAKGTDVSHSQGVFAEPTLEHLQRRGVLQTEIPFRRDNHVVRGGVRVPRDHRFCLYGRGTKVRLLAIQGRCFPPERGAVGQGIKWSKVRQEVTGIQGFPPGSWLGAGPTFPVW